MRRQCRPDIGVLLQEVLKEGRRKGKEGVAHLVGEFSGADVLGQEDEAFPDPGLRCPDLRRGGGREGGRYGMEGRRAGRR